MTKQDVEFAKQIIYARSKAYNKGMVVGAIIGTVGSFLGQVTRHLMGW